MADSILFQRRLPVRHTVDVFVAGGGPAGIAAALAAARQGHSVFLAEGHSCFGGMGTAGLVPAFMQFGDGENFLAGGIGAEIYDRMWQYGGAGPEDRRDQGTCCANIRVEVLKRIYDDLIAAAGIRFSFLTQCIGIEMERDGRAQYVVCSAKSGQFAVQAKQFVDCTGDGDLAAWAGAPFAKGDAEGNLMPGTLCSLWADVDWKAVRASGLRADHELTRAFADKVFTHEDRHLPGMWRVGEHIAGGNIGHTFGVDSTDERSLTEALLWGRKSMLEYERFYKNYLKGYEQMELVSTGSLPGIRESRRILGDYMLHLDDFKQRAVFADEIGRYSYPVDIHPSRPDAGNYAKFEEEFQTFRYGKGESYGIPYRTLTPYGLENILVAGRCLSADRFLQGSVRVMPGCYITGQAAGVAAALAIDSNTDIHSISVPDLQKRLKEMGAYLPNC